MTVSRSTIARLATSRPGAADRWKRPLSFLLLAAILMAGLAPAPANALAAVKFSDIVGQVLSVQTAHIGGEDVAVILSVEKGVVKPNYTEPARTELMFATSADPTTWTHVRFQGSLPAMAVGDVDGDGQDDIALGSPSGSPGVCPAPVVGSTSCGAIYVLDGPSLRAGTAVSIAKIMISPVSGPCTPSVYFPESLTLRDLDGDGMAELAFGMLGMYAGNCGVMSVFRGDILAGNVTMSEACASLFGPVVQNNQYPDQFGVAQQMFNDPSARKHFIAIGAPYLSDGVRAASGKFSVYQLPNSCAPGVGAPPTALEVFHYAGEQTGSLAGYSLAYADGSLWASTSNKVVGFDTSKFASVGEHTPPTSYPVAVAGPVDGSGQSDMFFGPYLVAPSSGDMVMSFAPFAYKTFRGAFLGHDQFISGDNFGLQLWGLTDIWRPSLALQSNPKVAHVGDIVNVSVAQMVTLVPRTQDVTLVALGGPVVESSAEWVHVKAVKAGEIIVQGSIMGTTRVIRVPVGPGPDNHVEAVGPDTVEVDQPLVVRVYAPANSTIDWQAPSGNPGVGQGSLIQTSFASAGDYVVSMRVGLPDGTQQTLDHRVNVFANPPASPPLVIAAPSHVSQGSPLALSVQEPVVGAVYNWSLESSQIGVSTPTGTDLQLPTAGWGPLNITVVEIQNGATSRIARAQVMIDNLPPQILAIEIQAVDSIHATVNALDPGGDPMTIHWTLDGDDAGSGPNLDVSMHPRHVTVGVTVTDDAGASVSQSRNVNVTTGWIVVKKNKPGQTPTPEPDPIYPFKVGRIKGKPVSSARSGSAPGLDGILVAGALAVAGALRGERVRRSKK